VIGAPEEIAALDYDGARAAHAATHRAGDATLIVLGPASPNRLRAMLRALCVTVREDAASRVAPPRFTPKAPATTVVRRSAPAPSLTWRRVVSLDAPTSFDRLEAHAALLTDILRSALPGGLAGPLRHDRRVARSLDIAVWPIDERHIEIRVRAEPDRGVALTELRSAVETTLDAIAAAGVDRQTFDRVRGRRGEYWPDWSDATARSMWMADYVTDRVASLREPLSPDQLRRIESTLDRGTVDALARALAGAGRTAVLYAGPAKAER
jgi:hypothetical protein